MPDSTSDTADAPSAKEPPGRSSGWISPYLLRPLRSMADAIRELGAPTAAAAPRAEPAGAPSPGGLAAPAAPPGAKPEA